MLHTRRSVLGAAALSLLGTRAAQAQDGQMRIVVPFAAGSGTDITARVIAEAIGKNSGRVVIVENRAGAGGSIGAAEVARARPDGNSVLYTTGGFTTNAALFKNLPFDPVADFTPIMMLTRAPGFALLVGDKSPFKTLEQFLAAARKDPGRLTFGSSGVGNTTHVMGVLFCKGVGVDMLHIPFKGTPTNELIGGTVDSAFLGPATVAQQIRAGQLRALGLSGNTRSRLLPDTPTFAQYGLQVQDIPGWTGIWGPARMPPDTLQATYDRFAKAAQTPLLSNYTRDNGGELVAMPPEPFKAYVTSEIERYRKVLPPLGIQLG